MVRFYVVFGSLVLAALTFAHATGWSPTDVTQQKVNPTSVRDNPGSYRAIYGGRSATGAK
jgi:hypothetical protein